MALVTWNAQLSVGLPSVDTDHKKLIDILNSLHDAMSAGKGKEVVGGVLSDLIRYAAGHFSREEKLMQQNGYEEFERHKAIHESMTRKVLQFQQDHKTGKASTIEVLNFVTDWLKKHILETDKKYGPFLASKGVC